MRPGKLGQHLVPELADDGADLALGHDVAVEFVGRVGQVSSSISSRSARVSLWRLSTYTPVGSATMVAPSFGDPGADAINVEVHVDAVGDGLVVAVLHDEVL